jgi:hypothetical protein
MYECVAIVVMLLKIDSPLVMVMVPPLYVCIKRMHECINECYKVTVTSVEGGQLGSGNCPPYLCGK